MRRELIIGAGLAAILIVTYLFVRRSEPAPAIPGVELVGAVAEDEKAFLATLADVRGIQRANRVTLYRIANPMDPDFASFKDRPKAGGYPVLDSKVIAPIAARTFTADILNRGMYAPPGDGWACLWEPGFVAELTTGTRVVNIVICLKCGDVYFEPSQPPAGKTHSLTPNGHRHIAGDLERMWPESFSRPN